MKELKFVHITKTGGSSVEITGIQNGIEWGRFHSEYGWWHSFLPLKNESFKKKYNWFTVVRNPYSRIVSEFYCPWAIGFDQKTLDVEVFNKIIIEKIQQRSSTVIWDGIIYCGDHWSEQHKYIDENVSHILKFENLQQEFNDLMKIYNLNIELNIRQNKSFKIFNEKNLSKKTIDLINEVYDKDFSFFNYQKLYESKN